MLSFDLDQLITDTANADFAEVWAEPISDVISIATLVARSLQACGKEPSDALLLGLTRLVMEREEELNARLGEEEEWPDDTQPVYVDEAQLEHLRNSYLADPDSESTYD